MFENLIYEKKLLEQGNKYIAGIDEVGRGPLAGPLVVAAAILNLEKIIILEKEQNKELLESYSNIKDSKLLSDKKRRIVETFLKNEVISYSIVSVSHTTISKHGISKSLQFAFSTAIDKLRISPNHIITDYIEIKKLTREHQTNLPKGDRVSMTVSAASIIAKVYRDNIMVEMHSKYPQYGFAQHKGYGTKKHMEALEKHGPCEIHRTNFEPIKSMLKIETVDQEEMRS